MIVPVGSLEQHGPHLPLDTDARIAAAVARRAAGGDPALLLAPPLAYGASGEHQGFPGTLSIGHEALRAVLRRANARLGTNWTMHDLRHTCALRMAADENVSLRDVQTILGHAHMETTAEIYLVEDERHTVEKVAAHLARLQEPKPDPAPVATAYRSADLAVLFGDGLLP